MAEHYVFYKDSLQTFLARDVLGFRSFNPRHMSAFTGINDAEGGVGDSHSTLVEYQ